MSLQRNAFLFAGALLPALLLPVASHAQRITGRLIDASSEQPVASAYLVLLALDGDTLTRTFADERGTFALAAPRPGTYRIQVSQLGYRMLLTDTLTLGANQLIEVSLRMGATAIPLDPLSVVARSRDALHDLTYDGLYARRAFSPAVGSNRVFVKGDREFRSAIKPIDLLWYIKPVHTRWNESRQMNVACIPIVFWHGFVVAKRVRAEALLSGSVDDLEGLEVYRSYTSLPLDYRLHIGDAPVDYLEPPGLISHVRNCGVVGLWPRRPDYPRKRT